MKISSSGWRFRYAIFMLFCESNEIHLDASRVSSTLNRFVWNFVLSLLGQNSIRLRMNISSFLFVASVLFRPLLNLNISKKLSFWSLFLYYLNPILFFSVNYKKILYPLWFLLLVFLDFKNQGMFAQWRSQGVGGFNPPPPEPEKLM